MRLLLLVATVLAVAAGTVWHRPLAGAAVVVLLLAVAAVRRLLRAAPVPGPGGTPGGGTAGVREPRRPAPSPPAGALALPVPTRDDEVSSLA
jgi:hypothetical protein